MSQFELIKTVRAAVPVAMFKAAVTRGLKS
jgi:hypothetical protein